jgi:hypothetical protein
MWVSRIHDDNLCACMKKIFYDVMKKLNISFGGRKTLRITGVSNRTYYTNLKLSDIFFPHLRINRHFFFYLLLFWLDEWTPFAPAALVYPFDTANPKRVVLHCTLTSLVCTIREFDLIIIHC